MSNPERSYWLSLADATGICRHLLVGLASLIEIIVTEPLLTSYRSVIETQAVVAELVEKFRFDPSCDETEVIQSPAGVTASPFVRGKEEQGCMVPIRVSPVQ